MRKIYQAAFVVFALMAVSCTKETVASQDAGLMSFHFNYPSSTKANDAGFAEGDKCGVYITEYNGETQVPLQVSGNYVNNVGFIFSNSNWSAVSNVYWSDKKMDIYAYYPYISPNPSSVDECRFSVATDQSTEATANSLSGYEASDFLWACSEGVQKGSGQAQEPVEMTFSHKMSKLIVVLAKGDNFTGDISEFTDGASLYVHNTVPEATIDMATGTVSKYIFGEVEAIKCRKVDAQRFEAIIVPQRLPSIRPFLELVSGDVSLMAEKDFNFKEGVVYTITLTLNTSKDQILIDIGGQVENWND